MHIYQTHLHFCLRSMCMCGCLTLATWKVKSKINDSIYPLVYISGSQSHILLLIIVCELLSEASLFCYLASKKYIIE